MICFKIITLAAKWRPTASKTGSKKRRKKRPVKRNRTNKGLDWLELILIEYVSL